MAGVRYLFSIDTNTIGSHARFYFESSIHIFKIDFYASYEDVTRALSEVRELPGRLTEKRLDVWILYYYIKFETGEPQVQIVRNDNHSSGRQRKLKRCNTLEL